MAEQATLKKQRNDTRDSKCLQPNNFDIKRTEILSGI